MLKKILEKATAEGRKKLSTIALNRAVLTTKLTLRMIIFQTRSGFSVSG